MEGWSWGFRGPLLPDTDPTSLSVPQDGGSRRLLGVQAESVGPEGSGGAWWTSYPAPRDGPRSRGDTSGVWYPVCTRVSHSGPPLSEDVELPPRPTRSVGRTLGIERRTWGPGAPRLHESVHGTGLCRMGPQTEGGRGRVVSRPGGGRGVVEVCVSPFLP